MAVQTVETVQLAPITTFQPISINSDYLFTKRIFDVFFTLLVAPFLLLIGLFIALCIKIDSRGPIFFRQTRIGRNGVTFSMLKFRSMYSDSDESVHQNKIKAMIQNGQALDKDRNDPRITRVGRFIRKLSLDELPQFWNVLVGEMTLVGPRPSLPYEVALYSERDRQRLSGLPGLTGIWQVYGRSSVTFADMVNMDIEYLEEQSLFNDLKLVVLTVPVMLFGKGAA